MPKPRARPSITHKRVAAVAAVATAACGVAGAVAFRGHAGAAPSVSRAAFRSVSSANYGPVFLLPRDVQALQRFTGPDVALHDVTLIGRRGDRAYYRIENSAGPACYAVGPSHPGAYVLGQIMCAPDFPSAARPILDFTVVHGGSPDVTQDRVWRSEGIAADGVTAIAFRTPDGRVVHESPVVRNLYSVPAVPTDRVTELVVEGAAGRIVYSMPIGRR